MIVGVPLVVTGRPMATCLWALPAVLRRDAARMFQRDTPIGVLWRLVTAPGAAWILHGVVVWVWHVPALYELAVLNEGIHAIQHAMFVGTSALFWWGLVYGRYGRTGYGASVFDVFTTAVHTGILGALFTLGTSPFYTIYVERALDPLGDQQLAGFVIWIPAGLVPTAGDIGLFAAWLGEADRRSRGAALLVVLACLGARGVRPRADVRGTCTERRRTGVRCRGDSNGDPGSDSPTLNTDHTWLRPAANCRAR